MNQDIYMNNSPNPILTVMEKYGGIEEENPTIMLVTTTSIMAGLAFLQVQISSNPLGFNYKQNLIKGLQISKHQALYSPMNP